MPSVHLPIVALDRLDRFDRRVREATGGPLRAAGVETLQVNVGKRCNQACRHCHVDAGPSRTEDMNRATAEKVLRLLEGGSIPCFDITGGAPELNGSFRWMVERARGMGVHVIVRHNLTVQFTDGCEDLPGFFAAQGVELYSSLPHYTREATDRQRGEGVFERSVEAVRRLNRVGYGLGDPRLGLHLVYNPVGAFLPGVQSELERDFKAELSARHGVHFDRLVTITNMPIERYRAWLERTGQLEDYMLKLERQFNRATVPGLMCRSTVSVSWDGRLYDCDFNQMLGLTVRESAATLDGFDLAALSGRRVVTGEHCFGCTAGAGSSCGGAIA